MIIFDGRAVLQDPTFEERRKAPSPFTASHAAQKERRL
jgi:hypothetical protein